MRVWLEFLPGAWHARRAVGDSDEPPGRRRQYSRIETKSRADRSGRGPLPRKQVADALADLWHDQPRDSVSCRSTSGIAAEKIRYARQCPGHTLRESAIGDAIPPLVRDSMLGDRTGQRRRLTSSPAKPPRSHRPTSTWMAFRPRLPTTGDLYRGPADYFQRRQIEDRIVPFGAAGPILGDREPAIRPCPGYTRAVAPWWSCYAFCTDPPAKRGAAAPQMDTGRPRRALWQSPDRGHLREPGHRLPGRNMNRLRGRKAAASSPGRRSATPPAPICRTPPPPSPAPGSAAAGCD